MSKFQRESIYTLLGDNYVTSTKPTVI